MVKRIIVVDSDVSGDEIKFVQRQSLPHTVTDLDEGEYFVTNTKTNNSGVLVTASTAPAYEVPVVTTPPSWVLGNTTVGTVLEIDVGAATGVPTPDREISYTRNGNVLTGQIYTTLDTAGFVGGDVIVPHVTWANLAGSVSVSGQPLTLTSQPAINATIDLQPAGQQSSITFNVAIKGLPTIAQGQTVIPVVRDGTTNKWLFIAKEAGPISFFATQDGYTPLNESRTVESALSALAERNYELVIDNDPGSEPLEIIEPQEYAGVYDISDATYTNGMRALAPAVIARTNDVIAATRNPLFSWLSEVEPVQFSHAYYRGTTSQNAVLIAGTEGAASYSENPAMDGGKNVYRRDWIENAGGFEVGVFSNGIAVAVTGWWDPLVDAYPGSLQVDYAGDRARINGQTYNSIAAAKSAGAILVDGTTEYTPIAPGTVCAAVGSGIVTLSTTSGQVLFAADDGQDADSADNHISNFLLTSHVMRPTVASNGTVRLTTTSSLTYATGEACSVGISINASGTAYWKTLKDSGSSTFAGMMPSGISRFCYGGRTVTNAPWRGTKKQFIFINGPVSNAELDALVGAIQ